MTGLAWLFIGAVCCSSVLADVLLVENDEENSDFALTWLRNFGYLRPTGELTTETAEAAVLRMQNFMNLPETGKVDEETLRVMKMPRCGVPDFEPGEDYAKSKRHGNPWSNKRLTYKIVNYGSDMTRADVESDFATAFKQWEDNCALSFTKRTTGDATILMKFTSLNNHGDSPFRGALAHAFYPTSRPIGGDVHFNDAYNYKKAGQASRGSYDLQYITLHEVGHSIGVYHSSTAGSIMAPVYSRSHENNAKLQPDDIAAARSLYGN